jgi:hypothetical protein
VPARDTHAAAGRVKGVPSYLGSSVGGARIASRWRRPIPATGAGGQRGRSGTTSVEDPRLQEFDADGTRLTPVVGSREYAGIGSWEQERAYLIGVVHYLVLEVRDLFERAAEHEDDHSHGRR